MNKEIKEEVQAFKETMEKYGLSWSPDDIAASADYEQQPQDQKEFLMLRAAERWNAYHETLCEKGEKDFADTYFPVGENGGPATSRLQQIGYYLKNAQEEKPAPEQTNGDWWDRIKSAVRNIFDLENER
ncbi:hypothetical protein [Acidithiobacillus ferriphilus]|uniref:hypothetical protein n=1 Tax=Acidithiobacillus ferriphilus TaxID=1689834 RepID=UPI002DB5BC14|nr:hypothetical protein [Acidithiobacillus ferriphilus]MEB8535895.1 hypothetical protein [Acidithiobacillus ferriphilus]